MIAKIIHGTGFKGVLSYLFGPAAEKDGTEERASLIGTNLTGSDAATLSQEFGKLRTLNPRMGKPVSHIVLALPADENIPDVDFRRIASEYLEGMGYKDCPYALIRHSDTGHHHCHLVVSKISFDGTAVKTSYERVKSQKLVEQLERKFWLKRTNTQPHNKKKREQQKQQQEEAPMQITSTSSLSIRPIKEGQAPREELTEQQVHEKFFHDLKLKFLWELYQHDFSDDEFFRQHLAFVQKGYGPRPTIIKTSQGSRIADRGTSLSIEHDAGESMQDKVQMMMSLAKAKGWQAVELDGSEEYLKEAFKQARLLGIEVKPKPEQEKLFKKLEGQLQPDESKELVAKIRAKRISAAEAQGGEAAHSHTPKKPRGPK